MVIMAGSFRVALAGFIFRTGDKPDVAIQPVFSLTSTDVSEFLPCGFVPSPPGSGTTEPVKAPFIRILGFSCWLCCLIPCGFLQHIPDHCLLFHLPKQVSLLPADPRALSAFLAVGFLVQKASSDLRRTLYLLPAHLYPSSF
jgi:hypothetical protein